MAFFGPLFCSLFLRARSTFNVDLVLTRDLLVNDLGGLFLKTISDVIKRLEVPSDLDLSELSLDLFFKLLATHFILLHFEGDIWDQQSDDDLYGNDHVFENDCKYDDVSERPLHRILLLKILNKCRLFLFKNSIQILRGAHRHAGEATYEQDQSVTGDRKVRNKAHDRHPIADTVGTLGVIPPSKLPHVLQLDADLEQVGQEGEKRCKGERHREKGHKAKLDDRFVIIIYQCL